MIGMPDSDMVVRSMMNDGAFRAVTVRADATAREAIAAQGLSGREAGLFAQLLCGAILYRETMAPQLRVQCILDGAGDAGRIVADSHPDGGVRGMVQLPEGDGGLVVDGAILRMARELPRGRLHEGIVDVPAGGGISEGLMTYMQSSEQTLTVAAVAAIELEGRIRAAGYLVQLLPEVDRSSLTGMIERLESLPPLAGMLEQDLGAAALVSSVFGDAPYTLLESSEVRFDCRCSRDRAGRALATAARTEVEEALADGRGLETRCEFCGADYTFSREDLLALLGDDDTSVH